MKIRARIGISVDGFVATRDGRPALLSMSEFDPGRSHGYPEFIAGCDAVVMGRTTFNPAVEAPRWPWPDLHVYVLTSRPMPSGLPAPVTTGASAKELIERMHADIDGDVHLVGGPRTIRAFHEIAALHRLDLVVVPLMLGDGIPLSPPGASSLTLAFEAQRGFPDGSVELSYAPTREVQPLT